MVLPIYNLRHSETCREVNNSQKTSTIIGLQKFSTLRPMIYRACDQSVQGTSVKEVGGEGDRVI